MIEFLPSDIDEQEWAEAYRRAEALREFLADQPGRLVGVAKLAGQLELSMATTYRLIERYRSAGTVVSLVSRKRGRRDGYRTLDDKREKIIFDTIRKVYLHRNKPSFAQLMREVQTNCFSAGLQPPHIRTVKARLDDIDLQIQATKRGERKIAMATKATPGKFKPDRPLKAIQIDHTRADVFVVDEETREPIARPWLTLAIDVYSRMVAGFYLSMEAPSCLSTSLCLLHMVFDKSAWLRDRDIQENWPVAGLPVSLHVDNGADFRSRAFRRGCADAGIKIHWRPPGEPHFGGHIERLIGRQMGSLHLLPGTTFSNIDERGDYDPKRHAALTLRELERYITLDIVGSYHQSIHSALERPPIAVWREHEDKTPLRLPQDRMRFWLTFLPEQRRSLLKTGIHLFGLRYWSPALQADVGQSKGKLLIKYDPRDMARVFVQRPSGNFVEARYADVTLPSVSLWEVRTARRILKAKGRREVNMRLIIQAALAQRELVNESVQKTAEQRQTRAAKPMSKILESNQDSLRGIDSSRPTSLVKDAD